MFIDPSPYIIPLIIVLGIILTILYLVLAWLPELKKLCS